MEWDVGLVSGLVKTPVDVGISWRSSYKYYVEQ